MTGLARILTAVLCTILLGCPGAKADQIATGMIAWEAEYMVGCPEGPPRLKLDFSTLDYETNQSHHHYHYPLDNSVHGCGGAREEEQEAAASMWTACPAGMRWPGALRGGDHP